MRDVASGSFEEALTSRRSGLGFAICCRLIDEFLFTRPTSQSLCLIYTTRDEKKSNDTLDRLQQHLNVHTKKRKTALNSRISFQPQQLDLTSLLSVRSLSEKLITSIPKLDAIVLNAGYGGFTGLNWPKAVWGVLTDFPFEVTYPTYKLSGVGYTTAPQLSRQPTTAEKPPPPLGQVFCSNLFGHYYLAHRLVPLLSTPPSEGRIIWVSSVEAYAHTFSVDDMQGLSSSTAYESSKRLTDILALTSSLPSTRRYVQRFLSTPLQQPETQVALPNIYLTHPGICTTGIIPLHWIPYYFMMFAFYLARWLGSPWHTVSSYKGACAPVWLALASQEELDALEERDSKGKWGSCVDWTGEERVMRTEVEGWGFGGKVGDGQKGGMRKGRRRGVEGLREGERETFEELGRRCWEEMEGLREEWEGRLRG